MEPNEQQCADESHYTCRRTQRWLDGGLVREKREYFRRYYEDAERGGRVARREAVVTFFTQMRGRERLDNEFWFTTNDAIERERIRKELLEGADTEPVRLPPKYA